MTTGRPRRRDYEATGCGADRCVSEVLALGNPAIWWAGLAAILIGLKDMRGDLRRFGLLVVCLAVGTALIAGVSSVGTSIRGAVDDARRVSGMVEMLDFDVGIAAVDLLAEGDAAADDAYTLSHVSP